MPHNYDGQTAEQLFGREVRASREGRNWSQETLARHLKELTGVEIHQTGLARLEVGKRGITLNEAVALAEVLGINIQLDNPMEDAGGLARLREELDQISAEVEALGDRHSAAEAAVQRSQMERDEVVYELSSASLRQLLMRDQIRRIEAEMNRSTDLKIKASDHGE